jgi:hypothetical protein
MAIAIDRYRDRSTSIAPRTRSRSRAIDAARARER